MNTKKDLTLNEIKAKKIKLLDYFRSLIVAFNEETGVKISSINVNYFKVLNDLNYTQEKILNSIDIQIDYE